MNINSPAYFSQQYGVDDSVYWYCRRLSDYVREKEYSEILHTVGIMPVAAPKEVYEQGNWKEGIRFYGQKSVASVAIHMDFETYYEADSDGKVQIMKETILLALQRVNAKCRFDVMKFREDMDRVI